MTMAIGKEARVDNDPKYRGGRRAERTTRALRDMLFDEIDNLQTGDGDPARALAIAKLSAQIINVARAEMDFYKLTKGGDQGPTDLLEPPKPKAIAP